MERLDIKQLEEKAKEIRRDIIKMVSEAGGGHPGGALSAADIITALFFNVMNHSPKFPNDPKRDRFILSKGHACTALYSALARSGYFLVSELLDFEKINSRLQGHPSKIDLPFVEASSGSLGQGISVAVGVSLGLRLSGIRSRV
ncbi:MAG: transketolase, partial [Candidatus Woesearchaeota archaeon]|nr:transketolase [Candidatus Woesearchaeota archaeon]